MVRKIPEKKTELDRLKSVDDLIRTDNVTLYQILDEMNERIKKLEELTKF